MGINGVSGSGSPYPVSGNEPQKLNGAPSAVNMNQQPDSVELSSKAAPKKASIGKKIGVGIASACIPGLGQLVNGQGKKGIGFFVGVNATGLLAALTFQPIIAVASIAIGVASVIDAVKNA